MRMQAIRSAKHAQMTPTSRRGLSFILLGWVGSTARGERSTSKASASRIFTPRKGFATL